MDHHFTIEPMTEEDADDICSWQYEAPFDIYRFLPWSEMKLQGIEFGDPDLRTSQYASVRFGKELAGFAQFFPLVNVTRIGLGMRPQWCGNGYGVDFVTAIVREAQLRAPENEIDLEVFTWNKRAVNVYLRAGFQITDEYERPTPTGEASFYCMVYEPPQSNPSNAC
ncbi:GNAT family N-acetyltransferase [Paenibacillus arenosi]|uniref:GNAT family N-acetyltransferase n=1 Tax=Paenibacillus arenosi TaxID=2774142 RepID=A0ABR9AZ36_9BACL|nr:GNAT family protein [Paenibacillus arenosi]MBD8499397.1 GNAT family N-acetyltransferase [Paenibacillus arenosi]